MAKAEPRQQSSVGPDPAHIWPAWISHGHMWARSGPTLCCCLGRAVQGCQGQDCRCTRGWNGLQDHGGSWRFKLPNVSLKTLITWRGSAKRSGTKSPLRCVQTWSPTTRNVWPLWLPTRVLPPSTKSCFTKWSNTYFTDFCCCYSVSHS